MQLSRLIPVAVLVAAGTAQAAVTTLQDRNSLVRVDDSSQNGMFQWNVDGTNQLFQQWFWFRLAGDPAERSIDTMALTGASATDTNPFVDPSLDTLALRYNDPSGLEVSPTFQLRGGTVGSGNSGVTEAVRLVNRSTVPMTVNFFQYCDFDVNGTSGGDFAQITGLFNNTAEQGDGVFGLSETVVTPAPSRWEVAPYASILSRLSNGVVDDLANFNGPVFGDCTWAFQWEFVLNPNESVLISKVKNVTPTPGALALLGLGGLIAARRRR